MGKYICRKLLWLLVTVLVIALFTVLLPEISQNGMLPLPIIA